MIIGLSGRKQVGKDLTCKIIQYLDCKQRFNLDYPFEDFIAFNESIWQRKLFAGKLKEIVCLLIGCTMKQLEDNDFKESYLSEEWNRSVPFPPPSRGFLVEQTTPRKLLQLFGTEVGRSIHHNVWVNALFADYKYIESHPYKEGFSGGQGQELIYPNWCITDVRFPNEVKAIEDRGGVVIRINKSWMSQEESIKGEDTHPSETSLDNHKFKYTICNNAGIYELIEMVQSTLQDLKII